MDAKRDAWGRPMSCITCRPHNPRRTILLATGIVLLSAGLRTFRLLDQSIWYDEAFDVQLRKCHHPQGN